MKHTLIYSSYIYTLFHIVNICAGAVITIRHHNFDIHWLPATFPSNGGPAAAAAKPWA